MGLYALINDDGVVVQVLKGTAGTVYYQDLLKLKCVRWDGLFNKPSLGYSYNEVLRMFLPPKPIKSFVLDKENGRWVPPYEFDAINDDWTEEHEKKANVLAYLRSKETDIVRHVYRYYPLEKQTHDEKYTSAYITKLMVLHGMNDVRSRIVAAVGAYYQGEGDLDKIIANYSDGQEEMFGKLVKIGIRTEWALQVVNEGGLAIEENRQPKYPKFPL